MDPCHPLVPLQAQHLVQLGLHLRAGQQLGPAGEQLEVVDNILQVQAGGQYLVSPSSRVLSTSIDLSSVSRTLEDQK